MAAIRIFVKPIFPRFCPFSRHLATKNGVTGNPTGMIHAVTANINAHPNNQNRSITFHDTEVNGANIHYTKTGAGKKTLLLLPGALGSAVTDFQPQLENFNKDLFTLIAFDPRGYGRSQNSAREWAGHFLERDAHDAAKLMQNLKCDAYSLLGWSDGAITAMIMAALYPSNVSKCVSLAGNSYVTEDEVKVYNNVRDTKNWSERMRKPFIDVYGEEKFKSLWEEWVDQFTSTYYKERQGNICKDLLAQIKCPLLVVQGDKDPVVPSFHGQFIADQVQTSRLVKFADGKHNLHFKYAKQFNNLVENFLTEPATQ